MAWDLVEAAMGPVGRGIHVAGATVAMGSAFLAAGTPASDPVASQAVYIGWAGVVAAMSPVMISAVKAWRADREAERKARLARHKLANELNDAKLQIAVLQEDVAERDRMVATMRSLVDTLKGRVDDLIEAVRVNRGWITQYLDRSPGSPAPPLPELPAGLSDSGIPTSPPLPPEAPR